MSAQSMRALALANEIRFAQAAVMREIRKAKSAESKQLAADALRDPTETVGGVRLNRLLRSVNRYGERRVRLLMGRAGIPVARLSRRVRELSDRERNALADALLAPPASRPTLNEPSALAYNQLNGHWRTARSIADEIGYSPSGTGQALAALHRRGKAERLRDGDISWWRAVPDDDRTS